MILTCSTCGHHGEDGTTYRHDCYWVFMGEGKDMRHFPEHRELLSTDDPRPMPSVEDHDLERDWSWLVAELREFRAKHGVSRMMRCVADAVSEQPELFKK